MKQEGPLLESLTHHLSECPAEFLMEPRIGDAGAVHVDAVVNDLLGDLGTPTAGPSDTLVYRSRDRKDRNFLRLVLVAAWLLHHPWFREVRSFAHPAYRWMREGTRPLADLVAAELFVTEPDRREELARSCLEAMGLRPLGETPSQAADRLRSLDSVERSRVIRETRAGEERARALREAMRARKAREAAAKAIRE